MEAAVSAAMSKPDFDPHFRCRWGEPPPLPRERRPMAPPTGPANIKDGSSNTETSHSTRLTQRATALDRAADRLLQHGHHAVAERLAWRAAELRGARA